MANPHPKGNIGKGRKKGVPNKITRKLKDMILEALDNKGGVRYLEEQAEENPVAFLSLVGKILPMQVTGEDGGPISGKWTVEVVSVKDKATDT